MKFAQISIGFLYLHKFLFYEIRTNFYKFLYFKIFKFFSNFYSMKFAQISFEFPFGVSAFLRIRQFLCFVNLLKA